jgi:hypothetical protein
VLPQSSRPCRPRWRRRGPRAHRRLREGEGAAGAERGVASAFVVTGLHAAAGEHGELGEGVRPPRTVCGDDRWSVREGRAHRHALVDRNCWKACARKDVATRGDASERTHYLALMNNANHRFTA